MALVTPQKIKPELNPISPKVTLKAAHALVRHLEKHRDEKQVDKADLLADEDDENVKSKLAIPLWLTVTAKERIATSHSLNPGKVTVPHPLYASSHTRICLITADPPASDPKAYKNLVNHSSFPKDLREKIVKVVGFQKLAKKHKSFESRRMLLAEYDLFLADERVIRYLPVALGSTFYKSTTKRPIPVSLIGKENWGKKEKKTPLERLKPKRKSPPTTIGKPEDVAADIEKVMSTIAIHLSPAMTTSIKVGYASWPAEWIAENVDVTVQRVVTKYVPNQWSGVKSIHLKGPQTAALPIYMADQVWIDENRVLDEGESPAVHIKKSKSERKQLKAKFKDLAIASKGQSESPSKKRKAADGPELVTEKAKKPKKDSTVSAEEVGQQTPRSKSKGEGKQRVKEDAPLEDVADNAEEAKQEAQPNNPVDPKPKKRKTSKVAQNIDEVGKEDQDGAGTEGQKPKGAKKSTGTAEKTAKVVDSTRARRTRKY